MGDFRLPSLCKGIFAIFGCCQRGAADTEVSGQPIRPIFKDQIIYQSKLLIIPQYRTLNRLSVMPQNNDCLW